MRWFNDVFLRQVLALFIPIFSEEKKPCLLWYQRLKVSCTLDKSLVKALILMLCIIWLVTLLQHKFPIYRSSTHKPNQFQNIAYRQTRNKNISSKRLNCKESPSSLTARQMKVCKILPKFSSLKVKLVLARSSSNIYPPPGFLFPAHKPASSSNVCNIYVISGVQGRRT